MGKKGSWFSAIKRVFTPHSKEKQLSNNQEQERKSNNKKEKKKKSLGKKLRDGETNSFLPIFRQPSSIEKILCEAEPFRGYMARRSFRALKGLVRLQGVVRGHSVKRQTMNAMKYMQLLVRVQTQVQSRRIQMLEHRARNEKDDPKLASSLALWKNSPRSAQDIRTNGVPLWWNWVDRQNNQTQPFRLTPTRPSPSPQAHSSNKNHSRLNNSFDVSTPNSSKSAFLTPSRPIHTPQPSRYSRGGRATQDSPFKDDDSLTSCPPFSAPSYMAPTVSAKAKLRANSNPKERVDGTTPEKRRSSFPLGSFKWNKGSLFMSNNNKGSPSSGAVVLEKHKTLKSVGNMSIDSTVSMPATIGKRSFNRFA
ncbi:hypothetical protein HID58_035735 [Brassica napus]|uniref:DUF4005 domain-containing protein n=1 Tax=Brassica napus TaxID=3708 RepID=A0ABQ8C5Q9_BRANA|nr:hypothetical protein HID58_035735 [Brassica napus]